LAPLAADDLFVGPSVAIGEQDRLAEQGLLQRFQAFS